MGREDSQGPTPSTLGASQPIPSDVWSQMTPQAQQKEGRVCLTRRKTPKQSELSQNKT